MKLAILSIFIFFALCYTGYSEVVLSGVTLSGDMRIAGVDIVMTGDSVAHGQAANHVTDRVATSPITYYESQYYTHLSTVNTGIGGNKWSDLYNRFDADVVAYKPQVVFIHLGVNCLDNESIDTVAENLTYINGIKAKCNANNIKMCVAEILPYGLSDTGQDVKITAWNADLATWCASNGAILLECHDAFLADGSEHRPNTAYLNDNYLHPNNLGNKIIAIAYYLSFIFEK